MKALGVVQCRLSSTRLPGKALLELAGRPVLEWVLLRAQRAERLDRVVLAITDRAADDPLQALGERLGVPVVRGAVENLPARYCLALDRHPADVVVRITADNPLTSPDLVDAAVDWLAAQNLDWCYSGDVPLGTGADAFLAETPRRLAREATDPGHLEHIVTWFLDNHLRCRLGCPPLSRALRRPDLRLTLDTPDDLARLRTLFGLLPDPLGAGLEEIIATCDAAGIH